MRRQPCDSCKRETPLGETFGIRGQSLCQPCADTMVRDPSQELLEGEVTRLADPTVCAFCNADNGSTDWSPLAGVGVCPPCTDRMRRRPFPAWLRVAGVTLVALAGLSVVRGGQYWETEVALIHAERHMDKKEWAAASAAYAKVREVAPDNEHFLLRKLRADILADDWDQAEPVLKRIEHRKFEGTEIEAVNRLLDRVSRSEEELDASKKAAEQNDYAAALGHLKKAEASYPESRHIRGYRLLMEGYVAFGVKDYDALLRATRQAAELDPDDPRTHSTATNTTAATGTE